ncbi:nitrate ABC transporter permease [Sphaerisporangium krabiense]|uniref:ABC-type nitrate/sulfonate/bicarbonate transport system permease component n=1 Tax=Sphaerisporangium krabiense TaxID=763782 RepID=A0A7W8Z5K2_9ACTN|nr:ABC transporter permease [Sphaerisporangium krabiense]MBB5627897.1 ABC-type nitrate/sulfonate/bicarbonate transport system permease component [Sphaerisporangium krabiense]GII62055.1 nitrate ABC transporter permease [Sphaerisporangium krabiense]
MSAVARWAARVLGLPVLLVLAWWGYSAVSQSFYVPAPPQVARAFADTWLSERLVDDALPSVARLLAGYALAAVLGVGLGVPIGLFPRLRAAAEPVLEFFRAVPPPVLVPLIMLLAGIDDTMKVLVIVSGCVWPILLNTVEGVRALDEVLSDTCRMYGMRTASRLRHLVLRGASPQIMAGLRQALSVGIILMVISEMFASSSGLGFTIVLFQRGFAIPEMWSGILLLGLLGFGLSVLLRWFERRVLFWHGSHRA